MVFPWFSHGFPWFSHGFPCHAWLTPLCRGVLGVASLPRGHEVAMGQQRAIRGILRGHQREMFTDSTSSYICVICIYVIICIYIYMYIYICIYVYVYMICIVIENVWVKMRYCEMFLSYSFLVVVFLRVTINESIAVLYRYFYKSYMI